MPNINLNYKMVTDIKNNFFTNNRFIAAESLPAEGDFVKGDLIVNIGENANDEAMWLCVESGNPGVWEVVGAGAGGNTSGGGSSKIVTLKSRVVVNNALSEVNLGVSGFNKATDTLMVFNNTRFMVEGVDYEINADSTKIVAMNGNVWNEELTNDFVFDFVVFKMMNVNENGEVVVSSANEIVKLKNTVVVNEAVNEVEIGIDGFNEGDDLTVYRNSVYMIEGIDYEVQGNKIVSLKGAWNAEGGSDYKFTFEVLKTVAKVNPDAIVGMEHLTEDVKEAIEAAGNIDLSGYATKEDLVTTQIKTDAGVVLQDSLDIICDWIQGNEEWLQDVNDVAYDAQGLARGCSNAIGTPENLLTNEKGNIVGAINELFQSANNGKELIANAIGEPLNAEDTFSAMSNDINGLLSTFKTNMMNNGIVVESTDKFKQLIDKLISDNTNKEEITYLFNAPDYYNEEFYNDLKTHSTHIEGYSYPVITLKDNANNGVMSFNMTGSTSSGFTGTNCVLSVFTNNKIDLTNVTSIKIVAKRTSSKAVTSFGIFSQFVSVGHPGHPDFAKYITIATTDSYIEYTLDTTEVIGEHYIGITVTTSNLTNKGKAYVYVQSIMLTSIGKNDALRDSLASILQEEGVDVTEEDDMASLIGKVDSEFDRKNANAGGGLDIISATTLPATGRENQICVITDNPVNDFVITSNYSDINTNNTIYIFLGNSLDTTGIKGTNFDLVSNNITMKYYLLSVHQGGNKLDSYIYKNNQWTNATMSSFYIVEKGNSVNESYTGGFKGDWTVSNLNGTPCYVINIPNIASGSSNYLCYDNSTVNKINLSDYTTLEYTIASNMPDYSFAGKIYMFINTTRNVTTYVEELYKYWETPQPGSFTTYTIDISDITGEFYLGIAYIGRGYGQKLCVSDIRLY